MNNKGIVASRMVEDYEVKEISSKTGLRVDRFDSKFTAVGNLVAANDNGAVVSPILTARQRRQVKDVLDVEVAQADHRRLRPGRRAALSPPTAGRRSIPN